MAVLWWDRCEDVHCGFWINWNYDAVRGSTLTLPTQWGLIVVGFFALFVKLGSENLWGIICFVIHQLNASNKKQDDIYHQFQLVLRNTDSEQTFIQRLVKMAQAHKGMRFRVYRRMFLFILLAGVYGLGFYAISGLSSRLIAARDGSTVLALSDNCGYLREPNFTNLDDEKTFQALNALIVVARSSYRRSASYARTCYGQNGDNTTACGTYARATLDYTTAKDEACPFGDNICSTKAIKFDTGLVRSNVHLGVNTKEKDSLAIRKTLTCAPLDGERYTEGWKLVPDELIEAFGVPQGTQYKVYEFGLNPLLVAPFGEGNNSAVADEMSWKADATPYGLWWLTFMPDISPSYKETSHYFEPIPALASSDSDLLLGALTNRQAYPKPVNDAWFNATKCESDPSSILPVLCSSTQPYSWLACEEQYQVCQPDGTTCSPKSGLYSLAPDREGIKEEERFGGLKLNPVQKPLYTLLWKALWLAQLNFQLGFVGRENLVASEYLWDGGFDFGFSAQLSDKHWQIEVGNWMNTSLALMQRATLSFARPIEQSAGPDISNVEYYSRPTNTEGSQLCKKIMGRSTAHTSFSVVGLGVTIGIVILFIITNTVLPVIVSYIQKRSGKGLHRRLEWMESNAFQLQRMAAEGRGVGPWEGRDNEVPMLKGGQAFNLTEESLKGRWGRAESYQMARMSYGSGEEVEMGGLGLGKEKGAAVHVVDQDKKDAARVRLLDE